MKHLLGVVAAIAALGASAWLLILVGSGGKPNFVEEPIEVPYDMYNPVLEGEDTPNGYRQVLGRDQITPVYSPEFRSASDIDWDDEALVIGVALDGEAKAYPVSLLGYREMVIDWIGGTPILVSW